ncbi:MAG: creatininase family protein, partial [Chloroflexi bacterium]|nr:creatininase family protein [Chloroflexota bacterium]
MNETSLMLALRPDLVEMERLPRDLSEWPVGVGGQDPRIYASAELGERALAAQVSRMAGILREALAQIKN